MITNPLMSESRNLDFLRASAVLLVLVDHLFMAAGLAERYPVAWDMGRLGVLMFFVHTSLVLMFSLERSELRKPVNLFRDFYIRRAFRIYPLSIVFVSLACVFAMPETPGGVPMANSGSQIVANLLLVQNIAGRKNVISPLWSLPLEIQMYLVLPFLYIAAKRYGAKGILKIACAAGLIGLLYDWVVSTHPIRGLDRLNILYFAPCFLAGIICYCLSKKTTPRISAWLWPVAVAAIVVIYLLWTTQWVNPANRYPAYRAWFACWMLGVLIPQFQEMKLGWLRTASSYVAKYSYGIYLSQVAALWIGFTFWPHAGNVFKWGVSILLVSAFAVVGYHAIEHPGILLGKLVAGRYERAPLAVGAELIPAKEELPS
jgi:peptidoglycan/LPS O-acetylase OafA/YrhL